MIDDNKDNTSLLASYIASVRVVNADKSKKEKNLVTSLDPSVTTPTEMISVSHVFKMPMQGPKMKKVRSLTRSNSFDGMMSIVVMEQQS